MKENSEFILKSFRQGKSIKSIVDDLYYNAKERESYKKKDERVKIDKRVIHNLVETEILSV